MQNQNRLDEEAAAQALLSHIHSGNNADVFALLEDKNLLQYRANVEAQDIHSLLSGSQFEEMSLLTYAIYCKNLGVSNFILDDLNEANSQLEDIHASLKYAIRFGLEDIAKKIILISQCNPSDILESNENALHLSANHTSNAFQKFLINSGSDPFYKNQAGLSYLDMVVKHANHEMFSILKEKYPEQVDNAILNDPSIHALAIVSGSAIILNQMLPSNTLTMEELLDIASSRQDANLFQALINHYPVLLGKQQLSSMIDSATKVPKDDEQANSMSSLLSYLIQIRTPFHKIANSDGETAWDRAIKINNLPLIQTLISKDPAPEDVLSSYLERAIQSRNEDIARALIKAGAKVNHKTKDDSTLFMMLIKNQMYDLAKDALSSNQYCAIGHKNKQKETALSIALRKNERDLIGTLVWAGAEICNENVPKKEYQATTSRFIMNYRVSLHHELGGVDANNNTILMKAIKTKHLSNFEVLLRCLEDFDPRLDHIGDNIYMCATRQQNGRYLQALLRKFPNIDLTAKNRLGENIFDIAISTKNTDAAKILLDFAGEDIPQTYRKPLEDVSKIQQEEISDKDQLLDNAPSAETITKANPSQAHTITQASSRIATHRLGMGDALNKISPVTLPAKL